MKRSVLVVDDEPNIVLSLEFLMKQAGFEVRVARDGEQALKDGHHTGAKPGRVVRGPGWTGWDN